MTLGGQRCGNHVSESVAAACAHKSHLGTQPPGGDRLVGSLAPRDKGEPITHHRLAGLGRPLDIAEHVHVHRATYAHAGAHYDTTGGSPMRAIASPPLAAQMYPPPTASAFVRNGSTEDGTTTGGLMLPR